MKKNCTQIIEKAEKTNKHNQETVEQRKKKMKKNCTQKEIEILYSAEENTLRCWHTSGKTATKLK